jgi:hypothetical protein
MSELLQFIIVAAFGAFCFGCGYLTAFIVSRNRWRWQRRSSARTASAFAWPGAHSKRRSGALGILKHLRVGCSPTCPFPLSGSAALILQLAAVEAP